jgi:hypothetical protein
VVPTRPRLFVRQTHPPAAQRRGAAVVEMAFVFPLLVFLLLAVVGAGQLYLGYQQLLAAAREGARHASLTQSTVASIEDRVAEVTRSGSRPTPAEVEVAVWPTLSGVEDWEVIGSDRTYQDGTPVRPCNQLYADAASGGQVARSEVRVRVTVSSALTPRLPVIPAGPIVITAQGVFRCE